MYCHVDKLSYRASNTILSCTSVLSFILTITDGQRKVHLTVISNFCPSYLWCWITFRYTKKTHHVTVIHDLLIRNVCYSWCIFKRNKSSKSHKILKGFISDTNSDKMLSDFRSGTVKVRQLRSQVQSNDSKSNKPSKLTQHMNGCSLCSIATLITGFTFVFTSLTPVNVCKLQHVSILTLTTGLNPRHLWLRPSRCITCQS